MKKKDAARVFCLCRDMFASCLFIPSNDLYNLFSCHKYHTSLLFGLPRASYHIPCNAVAMETVLHEFDIRVKLFLRLCRHESKW